MYECVAIQVETGTNSNVTVGGRVAYALWRSVYAVKQVDARNRVSLIYERLRRCYLICRIVSNGCFLCLVVSMKVLVLFDYFKSRVFGRDISQF